MPIINSVVAGGGVTPTGTKNITSNGTHDVAAYANANVQVPTTAPQKYLEFGVNNAGELIHSTTASQIIDMTGVTKIGEYVLYFAYKSNTAIGAVDFSNITALGASALKGCFYQSSITSLDLSGLTGDLGNVIECMGQICYGCTSLTSVNFANLEAISANGSAMSSAFMNCTALTSIAFPKLKCVYGNSAFNGLCGYCSHLTTASFPELLCVNGSSAFSVAFNECTSLTSVDLPKLTKASDTFGSCFGRSAISVMRFPKLATVTSNGFLGNTFYQCRSLTDVYFNSLIKSYYLTSNTFSSTMLSGLTGVTVHFPSNLETYMENWSCITNGFGGTNTTILFDLPAVTTLDLTHVVGDLTFIQGAPFEYIAKQSDITSVDASTITKVFTNGAFRNAFQGSTSLVSADFGSLIALGNTPGMSGGNFMNTFDGCTALTTLDFSKLVNVNASAYDAYYTNMQYMCKGCTSLTSVRFDSLQHIGSSGMQYVFQNCTSLANVYFPAVRTFSRNGTFNYMLAGVDGCTVHFPANLDTGAALPVGGTNSTVLFDLPSTFVLTGANTTEYERNPKYDTATALAWRVKDTGVGMTLAVDWTPYYTSGTTDPTVGVTLYSDDACTTAVTTISAIA